jgi:hypothetical protein
MARSKKKQDKQDESVRVTPKKAKNALGVAKVVVPAVVPVVTPVAIRAAAVAREGLDRARAHRLGVDVGELPRFTGRGAALHARIAGDLRGVAELESRQGAGEDDKAFAKTERATLESLTAAVHTAERMPASRRKSVHQSVAGELARVEHELLRSLGVSDRK